MRRAGTANDGDESVMTQERDFIYRKDLSGQRIAELRKAAAAWRYKQNCITAALVGAIITFLAALLLGVSLGFTSFLIAGLGAGAGCAFYAWGKYLEEKHPTDGSFEIRHHDKIDKDERTDEASQSQPLCPGCLEPINPLDYYCPKCGEAASQFTPYMPFVNIRFNYSIFGRLWRNCWDEKTTVLTKVISAAMILLFVPIMLIGLPFAIRDKLLKRKNRSVSSPEEKQQPDK
jgi:hypothetical protein